MTVPQTAWPSTPSGLSVNQAQETVLVADGKLVGRVPIGFAERLLASGKVHPIGKRRLRYLRLHWHRDNRIVRGLGRARRRTEEARGHCCTQRDQRL